MANTQLSWVGDLHQSHQATGKQPLDYAYLAALCMRNNNKQLHSEATAGHQTFLKAWFQSIQGSC